MATIKDVAKQVGVHPSTVSRVVAGKSNVSEATKQRVFEAMKQLNYKPNLVARSLVSQSKTKILGVLLPNSNEYLFHNPFFIQVLSSISVYAKRFGYYVIHSNGREEEQEVMILNDLVNSHWVDGIILTTTRDNDGCIDYLNTTDMPYVVIGRPNADTACYYVDNDNIQAMYNATLRLIELGYKRIAYISGSTEFIVNKDRLDGYKKAMEQSGLAVEDYMIFAGDDTENTGEAAMEKFMQKFIPEAVVTTDDLIAYGACQYFYHRQGHYLPVIGFNNTPVSRYRNPAFSSVDINAQQLGEYAAKLLINHLENRPITEKFHIVDTLLIERF